MSDKHRTNVPCSLAYLEQATALFKDAVHHARYRLSTLHGVRVSYGYGHRYVIELEIEYGVAEGLQYDRLKVSFYRQSQALIDHSQVHFFKIEKNFDLTPV
jgi:hypothetical protein